jgi:hypothetical protein
MVLIFLLKSQCDVTVAASKVNPRDRDPRFAADSIQQIRDAVLLMDRRVAQLVDDTVSRAAYRRQDRDRGDLELHRQLHQRPPDLKTCGNRATTRELASFATTKELREG